MTVITTLLTTLLLSAPAPAQALQGPGLPARPRDPFVFRCVLDQHPRMVVLALSDELWAAWDATHCSFYKAWKGGVKFDGPVYTSVHGPQPTVRGTEYMDGVEGDVWMAAVAGQPVQPRAVWRGYRIEDGGAVLLYSIVLPDGRSVEVQERPEFVVPERVFTAEQIEDWGLEPGLPGLMRRWFSPAIPDDVELAVGVRSDASRGRFIDAGSAHGERMVDVKDAQGNVTETRIYSKLLMGAKRRGFSLTQFFEPVASPEKPAAGKEGGR